MGKKGKGITLENKLKKSKLKEPIESLKNGPKNGPIEQIIIREVGEQSNVNNQSASSNSQDKKQQSKSNNKPSSSNNQDKKQQPKSNNQPSSSNNQDKKQQPKSNNQPSSSNNQLEKQSPVPSQISTQPIEPLNLIIERNLDGNLNKFVDDLNTLDKSLSLRSSKEIGSEMISIKKHNLLMSNVLKCAISEFNKYKRETTEEIQKLNSRLDRKLINKVSERPFTKPHKDSKMVISEYRLKLADESYSVSEFTTRIFTAFCRVEDVYLKNLKGGKSKIDKNEMRRLAFSVDIIKEIEDSIESRPKLIKNSSKRKKRSSKKDDEKSKKKKPAGWRKEMNVAINNKLGALNRHFKALIAGTKNDKNITEEDKIDFTDYDIYAKDPSKFENLTKSHQNRLDNEQTKIEQTIKTNETNKSLAKKSKKRKRSDLSGDDTSSQGESSINLSELEFDKDGYVKTSDLEDEDEDEEDEDEEDEEEEEKEKDSKNDETDAKIVDNPEVESDNETNDKEASKVEDFKKFLLQFSEANKIDFKVLAKKLAKD